MLPLALSEQIDIQTIMRQQQKDEFHENDVATSFFIAVEALGGQTIEHIAHKDFKLYGENTNIVERCSTGGLLYGIGLLFGIQLTARYGIRSPYDIRLTVWHGGGCGTDHAFTFFFWR